MCREVSRGKVTRKVFQAGASRYWLVIWMLIALVLLPVFGTPSLRATSNSFRAAGAPLENIAQALPCGKIGETEGVSPGTDLFRVNLDLANYPNAMCNDGTPATMFVRRYKKKPDKNKWVIFLLGGGGCSNALQCAERWCSINTGYGANKMSTAFLNAQGAERSIEGEGIFNRDSSINNFAGWNQVFVYYCSSDEWSGSASNVQLSATDPNGNQLSYSINFRGADIVEAVIATIQREPAGEAVTYRDSTNGEEMVLPDIDKAELVLFSGSSAGGNGVKHNVDRVGELLRKTNKQCKGSTNCPLVYLGVIDASYAPSYHSLDLTQAGFCTQYPFLCTYDDLYTDRWNRVNLDTYKARGDESCVKWHERNLPGTEWQCADQQHVVHNHLTTPLFIRQDLQDKTVGSGLVESGLTTPDQFGQLAHDQLLAVANLDSFAEEGSVRSGGAKLKTPTTFGPQCTQHYGLSVSQPFFNVTINDAGKRNSFHDVLWEWVMGAPPRQLVHSFTGPGAAANCP